MNAITEFEVRCCYRSGFMYCSSGYLYVMEPGNEMAALASLERDSPVQCPACKGVGYILTPAGKQLIDMLHRHLTVEAEV
jgi:hypothetical protein